MVVEGEGVGPSAADLKLYNQRVVKVTGYTSMFLFYKEKQPL